MVKYMRLVILFDMLLNPSFKMTSFPNIARTTASTSKFIYSEIELNFKTSCCILKIRRLGGKLWVAFLLF